MNREEILKQLEERYLYLLTELSEKTEAEPLLKEEALELFKDMDPHDKLAMISILAGYLKKVEDNETQD